jgi:hypothetical protein
MKVLICHRPGGAFGYISDSWLNAFKSAGIIAQRWDGKKESWRSFSPNLYIGCSGHKQPIPEHRACKIAIHVNPCGPVKIEPNINEPADSVKWVKKQKPDAVFGYGFEKDRNLWSHWERDGIPWVPMACAGDATVYSPANGGHNRFDLVYIGGRWDYKAKTIDPYLMPLLLSKLSRTVYGWGKWPPYLAVTEASDAQVVMALSTAKVGPCVSEPHTIQHGIDIPERVFKVILSGAVPVHDPVPGIRKLIPGLLVGNNPDEYRDLVMAAVKTSPQKRLSLVEEYYDVVFDRHTYHHRLSALLSQLGFNQEAQTLLKALKGLKVDFPK